MHEKQEPLHSKVQATHTRRWGEKSAADYGYAMVLEVDGGVELSGQGGWDPHSLEFPGEAVLLEAEINQAFENVAFMLGEIGLGWSNVAHVNSCPVPEPDGTILRVTAKGRAPVPRPRAAPADLDLSGGGDAGRSPDAG